MIRREASWFQITRDVGGFGMLLTFANLKGFLSCYEHEWFTRSFLVSLFYSVLSTPPYCLLYVLWQFLKKTGRNISVFESGYSRSYFNPFLIVAVVCDARKYKPHIYKQFKSDS